MRKVIVYIATSLDGFIAGENDSLDFLKCVEKPGEDYGYADFIKTIDTVIMGRKTYDIIKAFDGPFWHAARKCYVYSKTRSGNDENVEFYNGDIAHLITQLKETEGKDIFIDGGAQLVHELMKQNLIDRYCISIIPHFVGNGVQLFKQGRPGQKLRLLHSATYPTGLVQMWYDVDIEKSPDTI